MNNKTLLSKAKENKKTAELASKNQYYNSATNRIYYSLYQRTMYILNQKGIKVESKQSDDDKRNSHERTIDTLINKVLTSEIEKTQAAEFHLIRKMRNRADYQEFPINKTLYDFTITPSVESVESILKKYS